MNSDEIESNKVIRDFYDYINTLAEERTRDKIASANQNLEDVLCIIARATESTKNLYERMKEEGLTVNAIEAEGAYRQMLALQEELTPYYEENGIEL